MNFIKQAFDLNNHGVSLLAVGECRPSMASFQDALSIMKHAIHHFETISDGVVTETSTEHRFHDSCFSLPALQSNESYLFDRALLFDNFVGDDVESLLPLYSAVLLFNLALACHLEGRSGRERSLKRATMLYRMSLKLLENCEHHPTSSRILAVLALNNKAQIHYDQCQYANSQVCLREMSRLLAEVSFEEYGLNPEDVEGLLLNTMLLEPPSAAQAA